MSIALGLLGRLLIAACFIISGAVKISTPAPFQALFATGGVDPRWVTGVGFVEVVGGVLLALGLATRTAAVVLALFVLIDVLIFHHQYGDPLLADTILLHGALIGGLCLVVAHNQMWWSLDALRHQRRRDTQTRRAELRTHEAELRTARSERAVVGSMVDEPVDRPVDRPVAVKRRWF